MRIRDRGKDGNHGVLGLVASGAAVTLLAACAVGSHYDGSATAGAGASPANGVGDGVTVETVGTGPFTMADTSPVVLAPTPPPPLSGGTLIVAADGSTVVAADPDRDAVYWTNLADPSQAIGRVALAPGDEPGRLVEDAAGRIHVALRRTGQLATIDLATATIVGRTAVCPAPRGLAYDEATDTILVACVGGELVTVLAADGSVLATHTIENDLRDVVLLGEGFFAVSKLRTAEVLLLDSTFAVRSRSRSVSGGATAEPTSAWRMIATPSATGATGVTLVHELATTLAINLEAPNPYGGGVSGGSGGSAAASGSGGAGGGTPSDGTSSGPIVTSAITTFTFDLTHPDNGAQQSTVVDLPGGLPVDVAATADNRVAFALYASEVIASQTAVLAAGSQATSVAFDPQGHLVAFIREPAAFMTVDAGASVPVWLPITAASVQDTGHDLFHLAADRNGGTLACASCHAEGRDDGHVWSFEPIGPRRTPSLVGGLQATAPFHWDGTLPDVGSVMDEVFTRRMGGLEEDSMHAGAVARFLNAIPRVPLAPPPANAAYDHGKQLFESAELGCTGCHSGPHLTNNATVSVGGVSAFQVPTLIGVGLRAPYLHDGCAATLADRFGPCGGGDAHGHTSQLSSSDVGDLVEYMSWL